MESTLVLNASYEPLKVVDWHRAVTLWVQGKVEVVETYDREVRSVSFSFKLPSVVRLLHFVKLKRRPVVQFTRAKGFDTFCPLGPAVVTGVDPNDLAIEVDVDGETRQRSRTSAMVFPPYELVAYVSRVMTLEPGDLLLTGTPEGVGPLASGQTVTVRIEGLGELRSPVVARVR